LAGFRYHSPGWFWPSFYNKEWDYVKDSSIGIKSIDQDKFIKNNLKDEFFEISINQKKNVYKSVSPERRFGNEVVFTLLGLVQLIIESKYFGDKVTLSHLLNSPKYIDEFIHNYDLTELLKVNFNLVKVIDFKRREDIFESHFLAEPRDFVQGETNDKDTTFRALIILSIFNPNYLRQSSINIYNDLKSSKIITTISPKGFETRLNEFRKISGVKISRGGKIVKLDSYFDPLK
jgi:hypothetical protein